VKPERRDDGEIRGRRVVVIMGAVIPEQLVLWRAVKDAGIELTIVGTTTNIHRGKWPWHPRRPDGLDVVFLHPVSPAVGRGHLWWAYRGLSRSLARLKPDLIHVVSEPWGALVAQTLLNRPLLGRWVPVCVHGADNIFDHGSGVERLMRRLILAWVWPRIDGFASWSHGGLEAAQSAGLPPIPTTVVPGIIPDPSLFLTLGPEGKKVRSQLGLPTGEPVVGYVGRLDEQKGIRDLMEAIQSLGASAPFLSVWGAGPMEHRVKELIATGRVRGLFGGALELSKVPGALHACDIVVLPSRTTSSLKEQFGRVVVEAMMAGVAVVAYRTGAIPEVVGEGAVLIPEGDVAALGRAIQRLAGDVSARSQLATKGRNQALARFNPSAVTSRLLQFWTEARSR
jgi:glycosyltransferase involved in cell wall biosynthesis